MTTFEKKKWKIACLTQTTLSAFLSLQDSVFAFAVSKVSIVVAQNSDSTVQWAQVFFGSESTTTSGSSTTSRSWTQVIPLVPMPLSTLLTTPDCVSTCTFTFQWNKELCRLIGAHCCVMTNIFHLRHKRHRHSSLGSSGIWTRDLSHPKRESYP